MANRDFKKDGATLEAGVVKLYGKVVTTTSGTIGTALCKGFAVTKTATKTGRYTVVLADKYNQLLNCDVKLIGPDDSTYTTAKGAISFVRNVDVAATSASTKTFYIQWAEPQAAMADAELMDGASFFIEITVKNSSVY